jgi:hypothetical protein
LIFIFAPAPEGIDSASPRIAAAATTNTIFPLIILLQSLVFLGLPPYGENSLTKKDPCVNRIKMELKWAKRHEFI